MLVSTLQTDVRNNLNDQGVTFYTDVDILDSIQDSCDETVVKSGLIEKFADISFQANTGYYDLAALIPDFYAVTQVYNNLTRQWLTPQTLSDYDMIRDDWELWTSSPTFFTPVDYRRIVIVPRPAVAVGSMKVFYKARCTTLNASSTLPFPSDVATTIEHYATADLLEQAREYQKASLQWKQAYDDLGKAAKRTNSRSLPALIYRLREMRYGN